MHDDPDPIQIGAVGTVIACRRNGGGQRRLADQIDVAWDNGRTLMLVLAARSATNIGSARRQTRLVEPRLRQ
jgi:hypothetical protein